MEFQGSDDGTIHRDECVVLKFILLQIVQDLVLVQYPAPKHAHERCLFPLEVEVPYIRVKEDYESSRIRCCSYSPRRMRGSPTYSPANCSTSRSYSRSCTKSCL